MRFLDDGSRSATQHEQGEVARGCILTCSDQDGLQPVCGTDHINYPSRCHLQQQVECFGKEDLKVKHEGQCADGQLVAISYSLSYCETELTI